MGKENQEKQDALAKQRARGTSRMTAVPPVGAVPVEEPDSGPPELDAHRASNTQPRSHAADARAKDRARGTSRVVASPGAQSVMSSVEAPETAGGLEELERRRMEREQARTDRRGRREQNAAGAVSVSGGSAAGDSTAKSGKLSASKSTGNYRGTSSGDANQNESRNWTDFSNMSEDERQCRYDEKMAHLDQGHQDRLEKSDDNGNRRNADVSNMTEEERNRKYEDKMGFSPSLSNNSRKEKEKKLGFDPTADAQAARRSRGQLTASAVTEKSGDHFPEDPNITADFGVEVASDVENGEMPGIRDNDLAVAIAIDEEEEQQDQKLYAYAVEYDPGSKPPIYKNRRFRLYALTGVGVVLALVVILVVGLVTTQENRQSSSSRLDFAPTDAPTMAPTNERSAAFRTEFARILDSDKVYEEGTPHFNALEWILNEDPMQRSLSHPHILQRYMMAFLWFHSTNNGQQEWLSCNPPKEGEDDTCEYQEFRRQPDDNIVYVPRSGRTRWLSGADECQWEGVNCATGSAVLEVQIFGQNLSGSLPSELSVLPFLQSISFPYNQLTGTLPPEYANVRHLINLEVHHNVLSGEIPSAYFDQSFSLQNFNIGDNAFAGSLDTRIGLMTDLKGLHLFGNRFTGTFPTEIGNLRFLGFARVHGNNFDGPLPTELGRLGQLSEMWFHQNLFTGTIPTQLGGLARLGDLRLWGNQLVGTIPEVLYNLVNLSRLSVRENALTGTLSTQLGRLTDCQIFRVSNNRLTGTIPTEIEAMQSLRSIFLHANLFTGGVPDNICNNVRPNLLVSLQADCAPADNAPNPCRCCTACCSREGDRICLSTNLFGRA